MDMPERGSMDTSLGISRRTLLRRGAVVGGALVWSAPVVHTLAAPAAGTGTPVDGISFVAILVNHNGAVYRMKWNVNGSLQGPGTGAAFAVGNSSNQLMRGSNVEAGPAPGTAASLNTATGAVTVALGAGCSLVDFVVKRGQCNAGPGMAGQPQAGQSGDAVVFPVPSSNRNTCL